MLKTFRAFHPECNILICENSIDNLTKDILKRANIPFVENKGGIHGPSVDILLKNVKTDYALLVDTDVIFLSNHDEIFRQFKEMDLTLMGEIVGDRAGKKLYNRVHPWHCFINVKHVKDHNINFFDIERQKSRGEKRYDIGSSFFEDIRKHKLKIGNYNGSGVLYKHYEGMSWHVSKYGEKDEDIDVSSTATHNNVGILMHGQHVQRIYAQETKHLEGITL
jgi:hypothetical protein